MNENEKENENESETEDVCFKKIATLDDGDLFDPGFVEIYEFQKDICN